MSSAKPIVQDAFANALSLLERRFKRQAIAIRLKVPATLPLISGRTEQLALTRIAQFIAICSA